MPTKKKDPNGPNLAFVVTLKGFDVLVVYAAPYRKAATAAAIGAAKEAGYEVSWKDVKLVRRVPAFDYEAAQNPKGTQLANAEPVGPYDIDGFVLTLEYDPFVEPNGADGWGMQRIAATSQRMRTLAKSVGMITDAPEALASTRICKECGDDIDPFDSRLPDKQPYNLLDLCGQCFSTKTMTLPPTSLNGTPSGGTYTIVEDGERSGPFPAEPPATIEPTMDNPHNPAIRSMDLPPAFNELNDNGRWMLETYGLDPKKVYHGEFGPTVYFEDKADVYTHAEQFAEWIKTTGVNAWAEPFLPVCRRVRIPGIIDELYFEPAPALEMTDGPDEVTLFGRTLEIARVGDLLFPGQTYAVETERRGDFRRYEEVDVYEECRLETISPLTFSPPVRPIEFESIAPALSKVLGEPSTTEANDDGSFTHRWNSPEQKKAEHEAVNAYAQSIIAEQRELIARRNGCLLLLLWFGILAAFLLAILNGWLS